MLIVAHSELDFSAAVTAWAIWRWVGGFAVAGGATASVRATASAVVASAVRIPGHDSFPRPISLSGVCMNTVFATSSATPAAS